MRRITHILVGLSIWVTKAAAVTVVINGTASHSVPSTLCTSLKLIFKKNGVRLNYDPVGQMFEVTMPSSTDYGR